MGRARKGGLQVCAPAAGQHRCSFPGNPPAGFPDSPFSTGGRIIARPA